MAWTDLHREREHGNTEDRFTVAVVKKCVGDTDARTVVGYLPREVSQDLWYFLGHGGEIEWEVTGRRQHTQLVQGGLEIVFMWKEEIDNQGERSVGEKKLFRRQTVLMYPNEQDRNKFTFYFMPNNHDYNEICSHNVHMYVRVGNSDHVIFAHLDN